jgi:pimeloyl-ACP methyl ester carboxylesterase
MQRLLGERAMKQKSIAAAAGGGLVLASILAGCSPQRLDGFLYDPLPEPTGGYQLSTAVIPAREDLMVSVAEGVKVHVAFVPSSGAHPDTTMLYFHGQSNNLGSSWPRVELLYPLGVNLAVVDPRGYGRSTGAPSEAGIHTDLQAVWDALAGRPGLDATKFIIYGRSLGAAFAIDLAVVRTPAALITESAFASIAAMVRDGVYVDLPPGFVTDSRWDNLAKIAHVPAPYLAMHGLADDYVKVQYSEMLTAAHPGVTKLELVPGADHGDKHGPPPTLGEPAYLALLRTFLGL